MRFAIAVPGLMVAVSAAAQPVPNPPIPVPPPHQPAPAHPPDALLGSMDAEIDAESQGKFPVMERAPSLPLGTLQRSWDRAAPANGQTTPGIVHYDWSPDFVMALRVRDFMVTSVFLPRWESIAQYYLGDSVVFEVRKVRRNVVALRSRNSGADSNLTIIGTSGNVYNFYVRSEGWNSVQVTDIAIYVDASEPEVKNTPEDTDYLEKVAFHPEDLQFDMKVFAPTPRDAEIAPERVFHDNSFTYFQFADHGTGVGRPVVHQRIDDVDTVVNTRTTGPHGTILVAETVGDFTLRNGDRVVCIRRVKP